MTYKKLDPQTMTDRQAWAAGALTEKFHQSGILKCVSTHKDRSMERFLTRNGYKQSEMAPIISHMNACFQENSKMNVDQYAHLLKQIGETRRLRVHVGKPPQA